MKHYHAIIRRTDGADPNQRVTIEADTLDQATERLRQTYGETAVLKIWHDYFESIGLGYL